MKLPLSLLLQSMHEKRAHIVSLTSQGQITVPKKIRKAFGITGPVKAELRKQGNTIVIAPKLNFWALSGSLRSKVKLSDTKLRRSRQIFSRKWARHD